MSISNFEYFLLFAISFVLVGLLTPVMRRVAIKFDVVDSPNESHKTHKVPVPYLGGVAIVIGVIVVSYGAVLFANFSTSTFWLASSILIPGIVMAFVGLVDDIKQLTPWSRFVVQNVIGVISAITLIQTETIGSPTGSLIIDTAVTILWIVGITNAINFFDNLDGGASGTVAISSSFLFLLSFQNNQNLIAALSIVVAGSTIGFLLWNSPPARVYMGDAGALFLGLLIASLAIRLEPNPINKWASFSVPIFLIAVPILDTSVAVTTRLARRISPFQGGQDHLSHRLMRLRLTKRESVITLWLLTVFFASLSFLISNSSYDKEGIVLGCGVTIWFILYFFFAKLPDS
mgnify:CR=1 FL=1